jgi:hypothetical protein
MFREHLAEIRRALASLLLLGVDHTFDGGGIGAEGGPASAHLCKWYRVLTTTRNNTVSPSLIFMIRLRPKIGGPSNNARQAVCAGIGITAGSEELDRGDHGDQRGRRRCQRIDHAPLDRGRCSPA